MLRAVASQIGGGFPATFTTLTATTSVITPIVQAPTGGNVDVKAPNGTTIGVFNGSSGLFTAPFSFFWGGYMESAEGAAPAAPAADRVRIYAQDNGAGKTQLMALFSSGAAQQIAIQP